ncbi:MAG: Sapep family Mn(2+)-dependent dipeptidase [Saccharofermentanales bacterium]|mgnify:CR=1 FL=1|jgi:succinyl-diaminopimelate desuccinylase|nr:Sapep family Mn(2+)-dependent dipeptidase [Bacillota bacterium]
MAVDKTLIPSPEVIKHLADTMSDYREGFIHDLCELVKVPSVLGKAEPGAPYGKEPLRALELFLEQGKRLGFKAVNVGNHAGYLEMGSGEEMVAALCHLDVVPAGAGWDRDPFTPVVENGFIYGRGTSDNKGPAVSVMYAMRALADDPDFRPNKRIRLIVGTNEENGSTCMEYYTANEEIPVSGFTADADFPAVYAEKGISRPEFTWRRQGQEQILSAQGGEAVNMVPGDCTVTYKGEDGKIKELIFKGKTAHASMPDLGENAISMAMAELSKLGISDPVVDFYQKYLGFETDGAGLGLAFEDDSGLTTVNAGLLSIDTDKAALRLDVRYPVTMDFPAALARMRQKFAPEGITIEITSEDGPLNLGKDSYLITTLMDIYSKSTGLNARAVTMGGGTYARAVPNICAFGMSFPGDPEVAHQINEFIEIDKALAAAAIFRDSLRKLAE